MENEKNMNNSILGQAMENLRNRVDICLVIDAIKYQNVVYKPFFVLHKIFSKNWTAVCEIEEVFSNLSNYPKNSKYYDKTNKLAIGKIKVEGLRFKIYLHIKKMVKEIKRWKEYW